ncbi:M91 family zinc metallopeptidase [Kingella oralis]|uniref:M91 family zinc metallopeptidase n=1 Tax=Kingella oralis TaxID=505 RepID=UPI002D7FA06F|nr:M91 family zinc metallopeptidase [Kingella oralis]
MITAKDFEKNGIIMSVSFPHNITPETADYEITENYLSNIDIFNKTGNNLPKFNLEFAQTLIPDATNAHPNDIKKLDTALAYLQQNPEAAKLIEQAAKNGVNIVMVNKGHSYYHRLNDGKTDGIIFWNPNESMELFEDINGQRVSLGKQSPANVLLHELVHATDPKLVGLRADIEKYREYYDVSDVNFKYARPSEYTAVTTANELVSKYHNEPIRPDYDHPNYTKVAPAVAKSPIDFHTIEYNKKGEIEREITQTYDDKKGIVSRQTVDFYPDEPNKQCTVKETLTDIYGKPISQGQSKDSASISPQEIDWNKISNKDLYAAILSGDTQSRAALAASFAQSDAGMALKARGAELYAEQQAEQRQQAFQREWEQMQEQAEQRRQQEAEQQQSQSLSRGIRR